MCIKTQFQDRLLKPQDGLELQLSCNNTKTDLEYFLTEDVQVVHAPLNKNEDYSMGYNLHPEFSVDFPNTWNIHDYYLNIIDSIAKHRQRSSLYVIHVSQSYETLRLNGLLFEVIHYIRSRALEHRNIIFCIENAVLEVTDPNTNQLIVSDISLENVGTCFDICHAQIVIHKDPPEFKSLTDFFRVNMFSCKLIHLNQAKESILGFGMGSGHGAPFIRNNANDVKCLQEILDLYNLYGYNCPMTIEVFEPDYNDASNCIATYDLLQSLLNR